MLTVTLSFRITFGQSGYYHSHAHCDSFFSLTSGFLISPEHVEIIYLQHNLLTNITQDAFTRYVDLLLLDLPVVS